MQRFALKIAYDGAPFSGFQYQQNAPSVQGALEAAIAKIEPGGPRLVAAGRTDAGVHALGQVVNFDAEREWDPFRLSEAINYHLKPAPVSVLEAARVADDFSARFWAVERRYLYRILSRRARPTFSRGAIWHIRHELDVEAMSDAASYLIGHHDFTSFRSSDCQAQSPIKTLDALDIEARNGPEGPEIHIHARARSFLHHQVRSMVGSLERVGAGAWGPGRMREALEAKDRAACGPVAPAHGLCLMEVVYDEDIFAGGGFSR